MLRLADIQAPGDEAKSEDASSKCLFVAVVASIKMPL